MARTNPLPAPAFFDPANADNWGYRPDLQKTFESACDYRSRYGIKASGADKIRIALLLIDLQKDFCFPEGTLFVAGRSGRGAIDDNARIAKFIYRELDVITEIKPTFDTHFVYQIFFVTFWLDANGKHPAPHTEISVDDIRKGKYRPNPMIAWWVCNGNYAWLLKEVEFYCAELERQGLYKLYLWPFHTVLGTEGHALAGTVQEAHSFHAFTRGAPGLAEVKGGHILREAYGVFGPEVFAGHDGSAQGQKNALALKKLVEFDIVITAGQADSHCVKRSTEQLLEYVAQNDPELAKKMYFMTDCTSSVVVRDPSGNILLDCTPMAEEAHKRFEAAGMHLVKSTDPISSWPGVSL